MEPTEMQEFTKQLHEASEGKGESLTHISLAISILAVLVAMVTVLGHRSHTEAILMQSRAADQWNLYQAKKIRMDSLSVTVDLIPLQSFASSPGAVAKLQEYKAHIQKWKSDLVEEQEQAHKFEHEVHLAERRASHYDLGEALLQISVVLSSITLFTRRRSYFFLGLTIGAVGIVVASLGLLVR
jgi:predicted GIY-YIG superfamily endonuclease